MATENPIKYSDFILPDASVTDLITQLQELQKAYTKMLKTIRSEAEVLEKSLAKVSGATEEGRKITKEAATEADKLAAAEKKLNLSKEETALKLAKVRAEQTAVNNVNKLTLALNASAEGSYNKLSAQYSLNKIALNKLTKAEREANTEGGKLETQTKEIYEEMNRLQKATGKHTLEVGNYKLATENLHPALGRLNHGLGLMGTSLNDLNATPSPFKALGASLINFGKATLTFFLTPLGASIALLGALYALIRGNKDTVIDFNDSLINVGKTADLSGEELRSFGQEVVQMSRGLRVIGTKALLDYATVAGQLGVKGTKNLLAFTRGLAKLETATDIAGQEGATNIARLLTLTDGGVENVAKFGDEIVNLGNNFAATEGEILKNATAIAQNTAQYDLGRQTVLAYATATKAVGLEAEIVGSTMGRTLGLIEKSIRTGRGLDAVAKLTSMNVEDLKKQFSENPSAVFNNFIAGLNQVQKSGGSVNGELEKIGLTAIRDTRVISSLATKGFDVLKGSIDTVAAASGSLDKEFAAASDKLSAQLARTGIAWDNLVLTIEDGEGFLSSIAAFFAGRFADGIDKGAYAILLFGAAFAGVGATLSDFKEGIKLIMTSIKAAGENLISFLSAFKDFAKVKIDFKNPIASLMAYQAVATGVADKLSNLKFSISDIGKGFPNLGDSFGKAYDKELKRGTDAVKEANQKAAKIIDDDLEQVLTNSLLNIGQIDIKIAELGKALKKATTEGEAKPLQAQIKELEAKKNAILGVANANLKEIESRAVEKVRAQIDVMDEGEAKEIALLEIQLNEKRKLWEKYGLDVVLLENYEKTQRALINDRYRKEEADAENEAREKKDQETKEAYSRLVQMLDQEQSLRISEIDILKITEAEKTKLRLEAERDRLKKILDLNKLLGAQLSKLQIDTIKNTIAKIGQEIKSGDKENLDIYSVFGLNLEPDQKQAILSSVNMVLGSIKTLLAARVEAADVALSAIRAETNASEIRYQKEVEAQENGYANQVAQSQRELQLNKAKEKEALKEKEKAQKAQGRIDSLMQVSSLITASTQIWKSLSGIPIIGPALAIASIATMFGSFAASKVKASSATAAQQYGEGGLEFLEGGSHASGNDIALGMTTTGKRRTAEGGEAMAIVNKRNTRKYRSLLPRIVDSLNAGTFERIFGENYGPESNIFVNANFDSPELKSMSGDLSAIRKQGARTQYVNGKGQTVEIYKNIKRTYV